MHGDFSRLTFDPAKHNAAVLMQQGRVQLDSDWNEQQQIAAHLQETVAGDLIGWSGAPEQNAGFKISPRFALSFDGVDDFVLIGHQQQHRHRHAAYTLELRVEPRSSGTLVSSLGFGQYGEYTLDLEDDGTLSFKRFARSPGLRHEAPAEGGAGEHTPPSRSTLVEVRASTPTAFGAFHHVAVTVDRQQTTIYVDGVAVGQGSSEESTVQLAPPVVLGAALGHGRGADHFGGSVEELRFWNVVRTVEQIQQFATTRLAGTEPDLLGYWPLDEGEGPHVEDRSGHGSQGLLGGGVHERMPSWILRDIAIGPGRYYVDGVLCENEQWLLVDRQPDFPDPPFKLPLSPGRYLVYLDVWRRHLTALEDPAMREVGLGGPDTATRLKTVWQVKLLEAPGHGERDEVVAWERLIAPVRSERRLQARVVASGRSLGNQLYRIEIHGGTQPALPLGEPRAHDQPFAEITAVATDQNAVVVDRWEVDGWAWQVGDVVGFFPAHDANAQFVTSIRAADPDSRTLTLDALPDAGSRGQATRLGRVATFTWSRENGSIAYSVDAVDATRTILTLRSTGPAALAVRSGQWVELTDDARALHGARAPLLQVDGVDYARRQVILAAPLPTGVLVDQSRHPILRVWDQDASATSLVAGAIPITSQDWVPLENGIQVRFVGDGRFAPGDYWLVPSRDATQDVDWPIDASGPVALPPRGVQHRLCLLAELHVHQHHARAIDHRRLFAPLAREPERRSESVVVVTDQDGDKVEVVEVEQPAGNGEALEITHPEHGGDGAVETPSVARIVEEALPPGVSILGDSHRPPRGFDYSGFSTIVCGVTRRASVPSRNVGAMRLAVVEGRIFVVADSGELWEYDPSTDSVEPRAFLRPARAASAVVAIHSRLYVFGGVDIGGEMTDRTSEYDPARDEWTKRMPLRAPRAGLAAGVVNGKAYAIGGVVRGRLGQSDSGLNEEYDPIRDRWTERERLPTTRSSLAAAAIDGRIYAVGGRRRAALPLFRSEASSANEEYNPAADAWITRAPLPTPRSGFAIAPLGDRLYVLGGERANLDPSRGRVDVLEEYDPATDSWRARESLPAPGRWYALAAVRNYLYAIGRNDDEDGPGLIDAVAARYYILRQVHREPSRADTADVARAGAPGRET